MDSSAKKYQLKVDNYAGTAGDALRSLNGALFSTYSVDNDDDDHLFCARTYNSAWWYNRCRTDEEISVDLNRAYTSGILWRGWSRGHRITSVTMKIRPKRSKLELPSFYHREQMVLENAQKLEIMTIITAKWVSAVAVPFQCCRNRKMHTCVRCVIFNIAQWREGKKCGENDIFQHL